jgi:hypothetical protein
MQFADSDELCAYIRQQTDTVLLSFSRGKDSIAAYVKLRRHGFRIVPVHYRLVPHLSFIDESLAYYERIFGTKIYDLPAPGLYGMWNEFVYQPPERLRHIERLNLETYTYDQLFAIVKLAVGLPLDTYTAVGVTMNDSLNRRATINKHGPVNQGRKQFFPIYDYNRSRIISEVRESGISLPKDYRMFGRSFDGIDHRFLAPIREHYPEDYARILEYFPLAGLELDRMAYRQAYYAAKGLIHEPQLDLE